MSSGLFQIADQVLTYGSPILSGPDALFEIYTPDDYCERPADFLAFLTIFGVTIFYVDEDPCQPSFFTIDDYGWWIVNAAWVYSFGDALSGAPCTQVTYP